MGAPYDNWLINAAVIAATLFAVSLAVLVHYEGLILISRGLRRVGGRQRVKVLYAIYSVLALHVTEIWLFGLVLWLLLLWPETGHIAVGAAHGPLGLLDAIYLSAITFTTVGFGDLAPVGPIRFLSGTEALTGFVLITWSASFTFLEMERFWRNP
jgi:hypothetical protein